MNRFKIQYDKSGHAGIDVHELFKIFSLYTDIGFDEWWKYIKDFGLIEGENYINDWVNIETAKEICRLETFRVGAEYSCADELIFIDVARKILEASEHDEKVKDIDEFLTNFDKCIKELINSSLIGEKEN